MFEGNNCLLSIWGQLTYDAIDSPLFGQAINIDISNPIFEENARLLHGG